MGPAADAGQVLLGLIDRPELPLLAVGEDREGREEGRAEGGVVVEILAAIDDVAEVFDEGLAGGGGFRT
jgi:hypothetical protein